MTRHGVAASPAPRAVDGTRVGLTREDAGWDFVNCKVWRLRPGQSMLGFTGDEELGLVVLSGTVTIASTAGAWEGIGQPDSPFAGKPDVVYLPPDEETYDHRFAPAQGFGFQRVDTPDHALAEALVIEDRAARTGAERVSSGSGDARL